MLPPITDEFRFIVITITLIWSVLILPILLLPFGRYAVYWLRTSLFQEKVRGRRPTKPSCTFFAALLVAAAISVLGAAFADSAPRAANMDVTQTPESAQLPSPNSQATITNTPTSTVTITPSQTPTPTSSVTPTFTPDLVNGCINSDIWTPFMGEAHSIDSRGCWDLQDWGFISKPNGISIKTFSQDTQSIRGIYQIINHYARIDFDVNISKMGTVDDLEPKLMFGIVPSSLRSQDTGKYLSYQRESIIQDDLFVKLNDGTLNRGDYLPLRYVYGENQHVTLMIDGNELTLYIDGNQIEDSTHLPFEVQFFWIGYDLPPGTNMDAEVTNIIITDQ